MLLIALLQKPQLLTQPKRKCALSRNLPAWQIATTSIGNPTAHAKTHTQTQEVGCARSIHTCDAHTLTPVHEQTHLFSTQESTQESEPRSPLSVEVSEHTSYRGTGGGGGLVRLHHAGHGGGGWRGIIWTNPEPKSAILFVCLEMHGTSHHSNRKVRKNLAVRWSKLFEADGNSRLLYKAGNDISLFIWLCFILTYGIPIAWGIKSPRWRSLVHSHWQQAQVSFINCADLLQGCCLVCGFDCQPPYGGGGVTKTFSSEKLPITTLSFIVLEVLRQTVVFVAFQPEINHVFI